MRTSQRLVIIGLLLTVAWAATPAAAADRISVDRDFDEQHVQVTIAAPGGEMAWADLVRGLARARGFDDSVLADILPGGTLQLDRFHGRLLVGAMNRGLNPCIDLSITRVDAGAAGDRPMALRVTLDRAAMLATERRFKKQLREAVSATVAPLVGAEEQSYGLELDPGWDEAAADGPLVIMVHGFHSEPARLEALAAAAGERGLATGSFGYPNNRPLARSVELLADELERIAAEHPDRPVTLVTASMGGLIARAVVEDPQLDPGNVERLIMIAPPNRGSHMARFAFALDLSMPIVEAVQQQRVAAFIERLEDGLGEASEDLLPESAFLHELNARGRNPQVAYTIILGTGGPLSEAGVGLLRRQLAEAGERNRFVQFFGPRLDDFLTDLDEAVAGKGDGAVAVERGRLEGVDDVVLLPFDHCSVLDESPLAEADGVGAELRQIVLDRLEAGAGSVSVNE